jgi:hypothetical protein
MSISLQHHDLKADPQAAATAMGVTLGRQDSRETSENGRLCTRRVLTAMLPKPCGVQARFVHQGFVERAKKLFVNEVEVGSTFFDEGIYVSTDTREATQRLLESKRTQQALLLLVDPSRYVEVESSVVRVSDDDVHDDGRDATAELLALAGCLLGLG